MGVPRAAVMCVLTGCHLRFGQVPALEVTEKSSGKCTMLTQTLAMLRLIAKLAPADLELYPSDPVTACLVTALAAVFLAC